ncbi:hypothetical protein COLO4_36118 [Corchorus olitorius]|uniref:Uncharacterized protein n=1 Tax=Corchorus olitorius TaxID=93759 RepID=A0A1R3GAV0_9ROSI|nr:hypothetical protein COLO4_36118 [Corchorus olitorius]
MTQQIVEAKSGLRWGSRWRRKRELFSVIQ